MEYMNRLKDIAAEDARILEEKNKDYGDSWCKRGGMGAFMMLARKWDRIENQVKPIGYDIFHTIACDFRPEGILDDIRDLRRYLLLVEAFVTDKVTNGVQLVDRPQENHPRGFDPKQDVPAMKFKEGDEVIYENQGNTLLYGKIGKVVVDKRMKPVPDVVRVQFGPEVGMHVCYAAHLHPYDWRLYPNDSRPVR